MTPRREGPGAHPARPAADGGKARRVARPLARNPSSTPPQPRAQRAAQPAPCLEVPIAGVDIELGAFLKLSLACGSGGEAKQLVQGGGVTVNGMTETRRRHRLVPGDRVRLGDGRCLLVVRSR